MLGCRKNKCKGSNNIVATYFTLFTMGSKTRVYFFFLLLTHTVSPVFEMRRSVKREISLSLTQQFMVIAPQDFKRINIMFLVSGLFCMIPGIQMK